MTSIVQRNTKSFDQNRRGLGRLKPKTTNEGQPTSFDPSMSSAREFEAGVDSHYNLNVNLGISKTALHW